MYLMPWTVHIKVVTMVHFMLTDIYHDKKNTLKNYCYAQRGRRKKRRAGDEGAGSGTSSIQ
jgi:hypothetical protein